MSKKAKTTRAEETDLGLGAEKTKASLLKSAITLFAKQGYAGTTVKDISELAGVNISLISYHFQGKEGLYRACLEQFGRSRLSAVERLLQPPTSLEEMKVRLQMFIEEMFTVMLDEPDLVQILHQEMDAGLPIAEDIFKATFLRMHETIILFFKTCQKKGFIRPDIDILIAGSCFFGSLNATVRSQKLGEKFFGHSLRDPNYLKKVKQSYLPIFLEGMLASGTQNRENKK